ncbi:MAG: glycosyltransferase family 39 protein [Bacteroidota bacterium]|nr:glycosyltransferase family 39 protein [Bacteroidota bacterium]
MAMYRPRPIINLFFSMLLVFFVVSKFPYLELPYYWNEAMNYFPALQYMLQNGLTLIPSASLNPELTQGQPLLYYFTICFGLNIFGNSALTAHAINLLLAALILYSIFYIMAREFKPHVALLAVLLIIIQEVFWVQSVIVNPEIMFSLLVILALYNLLLNNKIYYAVYASISVLVHESALVLIVSGFIYYCFLLQKFKFSKEFIKYNSFLLIPFLILALQALLNYQAYGWFFYSGLMEMPKTDLNTILTQIERQWFLLSSSENRIVLSLFILIAFALWFSRNKSVKRIIYDKRFLLVFIYTFLFFLYSLVNTLSPECLLSPVLLLMLVAAVAVNYVIRIKLLIVVLAFGFSFTNYLAALQASSAAQTSIGYADEIVVTKKIARFMQDSIPDKNDPVLCGILMSNYLTNPALGYLRKPFTRVNPVSENPEKHYIVVNTAEAESLKPVLAKKKLLELKSFTKNNAQSTLYLVQPE